jgi:hypothetical protein
MHVQLHLFGIIALASLIFGRTISSETFPDGVTLTIGQLNAEEIAALPAPDPVAPVSPNPARRAPLWVRVIIYCGCGFTLNHAETDYLAKGINDHLYDYTIQPGEQYMFSVGNTVAFMCSNANTQLKIAGNQYLIAMRQQVSPICGSYVAGTWEGTGSDDLVSHILRVECLNINLPAYHE